MGELIVNEEDQRRMMWCCRMSLPELNDDKPIIVDVEKLLKDRAWKVWSSSFSCMQRLRWKRHHFDIEVPDNYYIFEDVTEKSDMILPEVPCPASTNGVPQQPQGMDIAPKKGKTSETITIATVFNNETGKDQSYHFRFEKNRRTEVTVSFQKGFTFGTTTNFTVGLPQIFGGDTGLEIGASTEYQVTESKGQTFEETVSMEATSDITVQGNSCYVADVKLDDIHVMKPFRSRTRMRMPQGSAPIYIKRKKDGKLVSIYMVRSLPDIFGKCESTQLPKERLEDKQERLAKEAAANGGKTQQVTKGEVNDGSWIDFYTEGYVDGTFACGHQILLRNVRPKDKEKTVIYL